MWLALAESGLVMRGKVFVTEAQAASNNVNSTVWNEQSIGDVGLPGLTGGFRVDVVDGGELLVTYVTAGGSQSVVIPTPRLGEEMLRDSGHEEPAPDALLAAAITRSTGDLIAQRDPETLTSLSAPPAEHNSSESQLAPPTLEFPTAFKVAAEIGTNETSPVITALGDGFVVAWRTPGRSDELTQIRLALYDEHGVAKILGGGGSVLLVSDGAAADTAPAISILGEGFAVAYKRGGDGDLVVKTYDSAGSQIGEELVVDSGEAGAIGEIAAAAIRVEDEGSGNCDQLALVYMVEDQATGVDPYGTIMLQRLAVAEEDGE
ncbi:MAG: hypothetical protein HC869_02540, partial [Rhodospirillales bacterium]|nr:hypothetical protein [Rhodospirillales bacterium]